MQVTITEFVLPNGQRRYHTHEFPDTDNLRKLIDYEAGFEIEQLRTGQWSLEIFVEFGEDKRVSVMRLLPENPSSTIAVNMEQMVEELGNQL